MLDEYGTLTSAAFRELRGWLWDIPAAACVTIDVGPTRCVDHLLMAELTTKSYARNLVFEACDWRLAEEHAVTLTDALSEVSSR